ncbi:MAG: fibronectin type III domain-containing protein, partial [Jatrophihabitantaceae bacterium]
VNGPTSAGLTWAAPVNDGRSPITGYAVTSAPGGLACSMTGATSCTAPGLTPGTSYTFTVAARNAIGTGPASAPSGAVQAPIPTTLTLGSAPATVPAGSHVTLSGMLTRTDTHAPVPDQPVLLQSRPAGSSGAFSTVGTAMSSATGAVMFTGVLMSTSAQYLLSLARDATYDAAASPADTVIALRTIGIGSTTRTAAVGGTFAIRGSVRPASPGTRIFLQRRFGAVWATTGSMRLSSTSRYWFTIRPWSRGARTYRTVVVGDSNYGTSISTETTTNVIPLHTIGIGSTARYVPAGGTFAIRGSVRPASPGTRIFLQRRFGNVWATTGSMRLTSASRYWFTIWPRARGTLVYRTFVVGDRTYRMSISAVTSVTVR